MKFFSLIQRTLIVSAIGGAMSSTGALADDPQQRREQYFEQHIRPLLFDRCYGCHSDKKQESSLRLDSRQAVMRGGDSGAAAISRNVDESLLIQAVRGELAPMPPDDPLSDEEIAKLERWVAMGLPWTSGDAPTSPTLGDQRAIGKQARAHWSLQPIRQPKLPTGPGVDALESAVDRFVMQGILDQALEVAPPADRRTLLRRLSFDLVGLPPTPDEVDAFVRDESSSAVRNVVDRLLDSPHYGERWARHWMDIARYADSQDWQAQTDVRYPFAYTYRDWLIRSLNEDLPYDDFIREQLAADFRHRQSDSPDLAALGFLTVGPRFRGNRLEIAADQIDVVTRGLMGLTVGCARCHDHKYDPIAIDDYYALHGVFASSQISEELPEIRTSLSEHDDPQRADFRAELAKAKQAEVDYHQSLRREAIDDLKSRVTDYLIGYHEMGLTGKLEIRGAMSQLNVKETAMTPLSERLTAYLLTADVSDPVMGPWVEGLKMKEEVFAKKAQGLLDRWTSDASNINPLVKQTLESKSPQTRKELIEAYGSVFQQSLGSDPSEARSVEADADQSPLDAATRQIRETLLADDGLFDLPIARVVVASRLLGMGRKNLGDLQKAITEVYASHPGAPPRAMSLSDLPNPVTPYVMLRGEPGRRGDQVDRRFISVLSRPKAEPFQQGSGRLELADRIASPSNPLTARVLVNRVWTKYFGRGLVDYSDDFGLRCPPPKQAELLDWLAHAFMENGWSLKWLHRTIVLSETYGRSSLASAETLERDPENHWLARQNRRRLDLESMRDAMLVTAGLLDPTIGGRSFPLSTPPYTHRRTVYAYVDRVDTDPMLKTFDLASPTASASERPITTIPQQALFLMNHPFAAEFARELVKQSRASGSPEEGVRSLYRRLYQRDPIATELAIAVDYLNQPPVVEAFPEATWEYGYGPTDRTARTFTPLPFWSGTAYQTSDVYPDPVHRHLRLTAIGGNPVIRADQSVIRRWIAPAAGTVSITSQLEHLRDAGDGVVGSIWFIPGVANTQKDNSLHDGRRSAESLVEHHVLGKVVDLAIDRLDVNQGDAIELVVHCFKTPAADAFRWTAEVTGIEGSLSEQVWDSARGFAGPPPPKLDAWEQLAQALLLTNEFHYLD